jgi:hypothetical protein
MHCVGIKDRPDILSIIYREIKDAIKQLQEDVKPLIWVHQDGALVWDEWNGHMDRLIWSPDEKIIMI